MDKDEKKVLQTMRDADKPLRPGDIARLANMDSKEVSKIIGKLKKGGLIHSPKRCCYAPVEK